MLFSSQPPKQNIDLATKPLRNSSFTPWNQHNPSIKAGPQKGPMNYLPTIRTFSIIHIMRSTSPKTEHGNGNFPFSIRKYIFNFGGFSCDVNLHGRFIHPGRTFPPLKTGRAPRGNESSNHWFLRGIRASLNSGILGNHHIVWFHGEKTVMAFQGGVQPRCHKSHVTKDPRIPRCEAAPQMQLWGYGMMVNGWMVQIRDQLTSWGWYLYPIIYV